MKKTLTIVIPAYNEAERLQKVSAALLRPIATKYLKLAEVIFVDDGSRDETRRLLNALSKKISVKRGVRARVIGYKENRGKGYAVKRGMKSSTSDYILLADIDMATPFEELVKFDQPINDGLEVVIGTRKNGHSTVVVPQSMYRQILGRGFTLLSQVILNTWVSDFTCGFKLFSKNFVENVVSQMKIEKWGYDAEILFLAKQSNYTIAQVPVHWYDDKRTKVRVIHDIATSLRDLLTICYNYIVGSYAKRVKDDNLFTRSSAWQQIVEYW